MSFSSCGGGEKDAEAVAHGEEGHTCDATVEGCDGYVALAPAHGEDGHTCDATVEGCDGYVAPDPEG